MKELRKRAIKIKYKRKHEKKNTMTDKVEDNKCKGMESVFGSTWLIRFLNCQWP